MKKFVLLTLLAPLLVVTFTSAIAETTTRDPQMKITQTLDSFHAAAAIGDRDTYVGLLTEEMVFLGTDSSERWQGMEFRDFVGKHFKQGRGWTYTPTERHVGLAPDGRFAWFDELLHHEQFGVCRGSGALVETEAGWRISQYNLSVPVPNGLLMEVVESIHNMDEKLNSPDPDQ